MRVEEGEGVEVGRPYGPGLPGFVPKLRLLYGVSKKISVTLDLDYYFSDSLRDSAVSSVLSSQEGVKISA